MRLLETVDLVGLAFAASEMEIAADVVVLIVKAEYMLRLAAIKTECRERYRPAVSAAEREIFPD